jgi:membrane protein
MSLLSDQTIQKIRTFTIPGFEGVPLITVLRFFFKEIIQESIVTRGSSIAFFFILSVFPGLIFLFTLIPYIPISHFQTNLLLTIKDLIHNEGAYQMIRNTINEVVAIPHSSLLSVGFLLSIYSAMSGVKAMISSFNKSNEQTFKKRNIFQTNFVALKLTLMLSTLLIISLTLVIAQQTLFDWLFKVLNIKSFSAKNIIAVLHYLIIVALLFFTLSSLYYYGPAVKKKFKFISAGSTLATILFILTSFGFSWFVNNFGKYNTLYGSIGSVIVIMLWIYFNSIVIIIGFELNASIAISKSKMNLKQPDAGVL